MLRSTGPLGIGTTGGRGRDDSPRQSQSGPLWLRGGVRDEGNPGLRRRRRGGSRAWGLRRVPRATDTAERNPHSHFRLSTSPSLTARTPASVRDAAFILPSMFSTCLLAVRGLMPSREAISLSAMPASMR